MQAMLLRAFEVVQAYRSLPTVEIRMWGGVPERRVFERFVRRHPLFPVVGRKELGVALIAIPERPCALFEGHARRHLRFRARRARDAGYTFGPIDPLAELESIRSVNCSAETRQGGRLPEVYSDRTLLARWAAQPGSHFGVRLPSGTLAAYAYVRHVGEVAILDTLLGHAEALPDGVMYLLARETLAALAATPPSTRPGWVMYDTWIGASEGLRTFKQRIGFEPYRVRWRWSPR